MTTFHSDLPNRVESHGPFGARLAIVGEAPGRYEDETGLPFVGPSGQLLDEMLMIAGINRSECYVANVLKYRPPNNEFWRWKEMGLDLEMCIKELREELSTVKPNCILALGNEALRALTGHSGIKQYRGSILTTSDGKFKVVPSIHPANFLDRTDRDVQTFKYSAKTYVQLDFNRAVEESRDARLVLPQRTLEIARDSLGLYRFLRAYQGYDLVSVDIEVHKSMPICIGLAFTRTHAISVPLFHEIPGWGNILGLSKHEAVQLWKMVAGFLESPIKKLGQNFKFDDQKLRKPFGIYTRNIYADTMLLAHTLYPEHPKALEFLTSIWTREPYYKSEYRDYDPKRDSIDRILLYNAKDAAVTLECYEEMIKEAEELNVKDFFFSDVMPNHELYRDMEETGLLFNVETNKALLKKYRDWWKVEQDKLNLYCERPVNVASPKQVAELIYGYLGLPLRTVTDKKTGKQKVKVDEDTLVALLNNNINKSNHPKAAEILDGVMLIRQIRKNIGTYLEAEPDYNGRMITSYNIVGTETGRSSTQIVEPPVRPTQVGLAFHTMTKRGDVGADLLSQFDADPGYVFVEVDMSQAEARIVTLLSEDYELLKRFETGQDIHKLTASWIFGLGMKSITTELRFVGKKTRHAGNYDMGKHRHMMDLNSEAKRAHIDLQVSEWRAGKNLDAFHEYSPKIRGVFHAGIREALESEPVLINPFGRRREFFERWGDDLFKEAYAHIPQSTVPDQLRRGARAMKVEDPDIRFAVEWHDSLLSLVPVNDVEAYVQLARRCIETPIDFSNCTLKRGCLTIPIEAKVGDNYKRLADYEIKRAA